MIYKLNQILFSNFLLSILALSMATFGCSGGSNEKYISNIKIGDERSRFKTLGELLNSSSMIKSYSFLDINPESDTELKKAVNQYRSIGAIGGGIPQIDVLGVVRLDIKLDYKEVATKAFHMFKGPVEYNKRLPFSVWKDTFPDWKERADKWLESYINGNTLPSHIDTCIYFFIIEANVNGNKANDIAVHRAIARIDNVDYNIKGKTFIEDLAIGQFYYSEIAYNILNSISEKYSIDHHCCPAKG